MTLCIVLKKTPVMLYSRDKSVPELKFEVLVWSKTLWYLSPNLVWVVPLELEIDMALLELLPMTRWCP